MYIQKAAIDSAPLGNKNGSGCQNHDAEERSVNEELDEIFEGCFRDDSANPGAEVVHFEDAAVNFATVVGAVRFMSETAGAECGTPVGVADEDLALPEGDFGGVVMASVMVVCVLIGARQAAVIGAAGFQILRIALPGFWKG
jgi:hypothetical protein